MKQLYIKHDVMEDKEGNKLIVEMPIDGQGDQYFVHARGLDHLKSVRADEVTLFFRKPVTKAKI